MGFVLSKKGDDCKLQECIADVFAGSVCSTQVYHTRFIMNRNFLFRLIFKSKWCVNDIVCVCTLQYSTVYQLSQYILPQNTISVLLLQNGVSYLWNWIAISEWKHFPVFFSVVYTLYLLKTPRSWWRWKLAPASSLPWRWPGKESWRKALETSHGICSYERHPSSPPRASGCVWRKMIENFIFWH